MASLSEGFPKKTCVPLLQTFPVPLLTNVASRILHHIPATSPVFSPEEVGKLAQATSLTDNDAGVAIDALKALFRHAVYTMIKPVALSSGLTSLGLGEEQVLALADLWRSRAQTVVQKLKKETGVVGGAQLQDVSWELGLTMASSRRDRLQDPKAKLSLALKDAAQTATDPSGTSADEDQVLLEFSHDELYAFYQQLESIQEQMDTMVK